MNGEQNGEETAAWSLLQKHCIEPDGFLDQIEHGKDVSVKMGVEPETCQELEEMRQAIQFIGSFPQEMVFKWQISLFLHVDTRLQTMIQTMPERSLLLHTLHAKLFTWFINAWYVPELEPPQTPSPEEDLARKFSDLSLDLRLFEIKRELLAELLLALDLFVERWKGQLSLPRSVAWHFVQVPIMDWSAQWYHRKKRKEEIDEMKDQLLSLIDTCLST